MSIHFHGPRYAFSDKMEFWLQSIASLSKKDAYVSNFKGEQVFEVEVLIIFRFKCRHDRCAGRHSGKLCKIDFRPFVDE